MFAPFLVGSRACGFEKPGSDVDLAVYIPDPKLRELLFEKSDKLTGKSGSPKYGELNLVVLKSWDEVLAWRLAVWITQKYPETGETRPRRVKTYAVFKRRHWIWNVLACVFPPTKKQMQRVIRGTKSTASYNHEPVLLKLEGHKECSQTKNSLKL